MYIKLASIATISPFSYRNYSQRTAEAYVINFLGLSILVFGWLVTYIVTKPEYKRENPASTDYIPHINE